MTRCPELIKVDGEDEHELGKIIACKLHRKKLQYKVSWVGYDPDDTWIMMEMVRDGLARGISISKGRSMTYHFLPIRHSHPHLRLEEEAIPIVAFPRLEWIYQFNIVSAEDLHE